MAATELCQTCRCRTATIYCVTEATYFCSNCDNLRHLGRDAGHVRYRICDECMFNPAQILCYDHKIVLCQSCFSLDYNCPTFGHRLEIINPLPQTQNHHNNNNYIIPEHNMPRRYVRERLFEMICYGNSNCERWMFPVKCESCVGPSNAVVYCGQHDRLLCHNCDRMMHCPCRKVPPPHMRFVLCVSCKRLSHNFLIGASQFSLPPTHPSAVAEEVSAPPSTGPSQQDSMNLS